METPVAPLAAARGGDARLCGSRAPLDKALALERAPSPLLRASGAENCARGGLERQLQGEDEGDAVAQRASGAQLCDECERSRARLECDACGLVYCAACDAHRHRKGKLQLHVRARIAGGGAVSPAFGAASVAVKGATEEGGGDEDAVEAWGLEDVGRWLRDNDLDVFVQDAETLGLDGRALLESGKVDAFLDAATCSASRALKKKLQREAQKLREAQDTSEPTARRLPDGAQALGTASRMGLNLHVDVASDVDASNVESSFSPVAALRARLAHGQTGDDARGRVLRRRSAFPGAAVDPSSPLTIGNKGGLGPQVVTEKRSRSMFLGATSLKIDVGTPPPAPISTGAPPSNPSSIGKRQLVGIGALDLDMLQVKHEESVLAASFDFSAEGRLQTQGFEINTNGIANVPFHTRNRVLRKEEAVSTPSSATSSSIASSTASTTSPPSTSMGTREYLLILNELGHGAGGKVYKALYLPTFKLVAVKVIRVYDQKKRHQMVRELKSLYVNYVPIAEADTGVEAACEELVIFYDAFTNPEAGSVSIVLEYMDGGSVEDCMRSTGGTGAPEAAIANLAYCGLRGLTFLHEHHQLHRDIKLSNMLINHAGQVKISDFGISRDLESTLAKATTFTGTLLYMAPERISGGMYSYPSDIWSFGLAVMAYAIGRLPVPTQDGYWGVVHAVQEKPSPRLQDFGPNFSPELCDFVDQCLQKNPHARPSAAQLLRHPFIRNNYRSPCEGTTSALFLGFADAYGKGEDRASKKRAELEAIATKVESWCQVHGESLMASTACSSPSSSVFHRIPLAQKVAALARQMRLPPDEVSARFNFLSRYCSA